MRLAFSIAGAVLTFSLLLGAMQDNTRDWKPIQKEFKRLAIERSPNARVRDSIEKIDTEVKQDFLPELGVADRCRSCHLGIVNPFMADVPNPHRSHPGDLLKSHPPERFGCTVCHQGQGLATTKKAAHAKEIHFWDKPKLSPPFIEATCEQCHRGEEIKGAVVLNDGRRIFNNNGCAGCHKTYEKGGTLGPDLTGLGEASPYMKHPTEKNLERFVARTDGDVNLAYILESIEMPAAQPETTTMPTYVFSDWELKALTVYLKALNSQNFPAVYQSKKSAPKKDPSAREYFVRYCSACHGKNGQGGLHIGRMGTALKNDDFLSLGSPKFIKGIIKEGRNSDNKVMPAWRKGVGGLEKKEIDLLVRYVLSWRADYRKLKEIETTPMSTDEGHEFFQRSCADCHGSKGEGNIGPSLRSEEFYQIASTRFLFETLEKGRPGTAMPAWNTLTPGQTGQLIGYLKNYHLPNVDTAKVEAKGDTSLGNKIFDGKCATCHEHGGRGGIGPSLNSPELGGFADDNFYVSTIVGGRRDSGMPAWDGLGYRQISAVIAYTRSLTPASNMGTPPVGEGDDSEAKQLFEGVCGKCHGILGEGGTGPAIGAPEFLKAATDTFISGTVKYGRTGTEMRPHGRVLSALADFTDQEIIGIVAYIRTLGSSPVVRQTIRGSVDAGRGWYNSICLNCHGADGQGGTGPALSNPYSMATTSDGYLQAQMALGRTGTEMRPMTPYAGGLVEIDRAKINDIIAFLRDQSGQIEIPDEYAQTAFGSVPEGAVWFEDVCAKCHGKRGHGTVAAPGLNDVNFLKYATDGFLEGTMIRGRMHTGMRSFGKHGDGIASLTHRDIANVAAYIRSWVKPDLGQAPEPTSQKSTESIALVQNNSIEE